MVALYNEIDPYAAQWLRNLIAAGHIAPGVVDERSIVDLTPDDVAGYTQVHFFAGIGVWSYSLRQAGWPDSTPVWTGSCPCQPFSAAGQGHGFADERHLWPAFHHLIRECRPAIVLGEQVASKDGLAWLDLVQSDMEGTGYAFGAVDTCSASVGAPHIRQRLRFAAIRMADASTGGRREERADAGRGAVGDRTQGFTAGFVPRSDAGQLADAAHQLDDRAGSRRSRGWLEHSDSGAIGQLADADDARSQGRLRVPERADQRAPGALGVVGTAPAGGPTNGFWSNPDWLYCRDGKWRPVEPGTFPLAHGAPARVGRLRAYGNAVDAEATREFCEAVRATLNEINAGVSA